MSTELRNSKHVAAISRRGELAKIQLEDDGVFSGYASLFSVMDLGGDVIEKGAFIASLQRRGARNIRMLWQHDRSEPVGIWNIIREDNRGLFVEGKLTRGVSRAEEALQLLRAGSIDGLSVGFQPVRSRKHKATGGRQLLEVDLWEISIVTFPMLPQARITHVKAEVASILSYYDRNLLASHIRSATAVVRPDSSP